MTTLKKISCPNCGKTFDPEFKFCPYCGQENKEPTLKFKDLLSEFFSANFNLDSKFIQTLKVLLLFPGRLTREILQGKRTKYVTPIRLYLLISLVYFFVISFSQKDNTLVSLNTKDQDQNQAAIVIDHPQNDSLNPITKYIVQKTQLLSTKSGKEIFWQKFKNSISLGMFIFIPLTAWLLFLLFRKPYPYYVPHLIFAFHFQSVIFLIFIFFTLIRMVLDWDIWILLELIIITFLSFKWFLNFYNLSWGKTIFKMILFGVSWTFLLLIFLTISFGFSLLTL